MARPPLVLDTPGNITVRAYDDKFIAHCWYRDHDGTTRKIERHGKTKTTARTRLHEAIGQLHRSGSSVSVFRIRAHGAS